MNLVTYLVVIICVGVAVIIYVGVAVIYSFILLVIVLPICQFVAVIYLDKFRAHTNAYVYCFVGLLPLGLDASRPERPGTIYTLLGCFFCHFVCHISV